MPATFADTPTFTHLQLGLRTVTRHHVEQIERFGVSAHHMRDFPDTKAGLAELMGELIPRPSSPGLTTDVYVSFDLDVLDPAFAPGVSHHEPGGMSTRQALDTLLLLPPHARVVAADVVEYNPSRDIGGVTAMVGAKIIKELLGCMMAHKR